MNIKKLYIKKILCYFLLIVLIIFIFYLRFKHLELWGLSGDEIVTARAPLFIDRRCFIYAFIINSFAKSVIFITGINFVSEALLRLPSAIAALITVPVLWISGKKIKDEFTSLILISLFAFSYYLTGYARDARFYSFYFLASSLVLYCIISLFSTEKKEKTYYYFWLLMYSISMVFCMGIHQGSYLFYATANIFLGITFLIELIINFWNGNYKKSLIDFIIKLSIICIPILVIIGLLVKMSKGELSNDINDNHPLLISLSWNSLRTLQIPFYQLYPYAGKLLLIATFSPLYLIFRKKNRQTTLFCVFVKYATFLFLHFLSQSVVKEPLREKYILYILSIDLLLLSLTISTLLEDISNLTSFIYKKYSQIIKNTIYFLLSLSLILFFWIKAFPKIQNSNLYTSYRQDTKVLANKLDSVGPNDLIIIFGNYEGVNNALEYEKRRNVNRGNWHFISNPRSYKSIVPRQKSGFVWYVFANNYLNADNYVDTIWQDKFLSLYKSKKEISADLDKIAVLTAELLKNTSSRDGLFNQFSDSVNRQKENLLADMYVEAKTAKKYLDENLILNGSFSKRSEHWSFPKNLKENVDYYFNYKNGSSYLSLSCPAGKQVGISQNFSVTSGQCYKISARVRKNEKSSANLIGAYMVVYGQNDNKGQYLVFYDNYISWASKSMLYYPLKSGNALIQVRNGYGNIPETTIADYTDIRIQREIEVDFDKNLLRNGTFTNQFSGWEVCSYNNMLLVESENSTNIVKIQNTNGQKSNISQTFNVVSGTVYNIFFSAKKEESSFNSGAFMILKGTSINKDKEQYLFMPKLKSDWEYKYLSIKSMRTGKATLFLMTGHNNVNGTVFYKDVYVYEK